MVVGVDPSGDMLEVARSLSPPSGATIEWREASAERLPLSDRSCDTVTCQLGLMLAADRAAAVREMHRVLHTHGRVAINVPGSMQPLFDIMGNGLAHHVDKALAGFVNAVFSMDDPSELDSLLHEGRFVDAAVETVTPTFRLGPPNEFLEGYINSTPLADAIADADQTQLELLHDEVVAAWQPFTDNGSLVVDQPIIVATAGVR
jgi:SAM-dependent methyltransferase